MRVCVYGAGAIGGYLAGKLARSGVEVAVVARGPHLAALQVDGLTVQAGGEEFQVRVEAAEDPLSMRPADYVVVALKAHQVAGAVDGIRHLCGDGGAVVTAANGVPWWYTYGLKGPFENRRVEAVDPGGRIWAGIGPERAIGCVVWPAAEIVGPGVIRHIASERFDLGEPTGERSERVQRLSQAMIAAGLKAPVRPRLRDDIWTKLWGNCCFNPVSALTGATLGDITADPELRALCRRVMTEARGIGEAMGARFLMEVEKRIDAAGATGAHKTSMLQDLERGRPLEIDALVTAVLELGRMAGLDSPNLASVHALVTARARVLGLYGQA
ncbi:2-dehydropantoate 2-reductase [Geminicoccus harenae]|uniref:2-dehydropantoate 2-reductase n=1 Tax=Geminicoccus harenae TaxID=2498453 RepID=UPI00168B3AC9|nr:2-dehydropantoate 2-reductase [Geminicoccus harenae]